MSASKFLAEIGRAAGASKPNPESTRRERLKALAKEIREGDEDTAADALEALMALQPQPNP